MLNFGKAVLLGIISSVSELSNTVLPDELTPEKKEATAQTIVPLYGFLKTSGQKWVKSTETDIDDAVVKEGIEICEAISEKYDISLNAADYDW